MLLTGSEPAQLEHMKAKDFFFLHPEQQWVKRSVLESLRFHKGLALLTFRDIDSMTKAEQLRGTEVYVDRQDLPTPGDDEFYYDDLIGLRIIDDRSGVPIGHITSILSGTGAEVLELDLKGEKVLLPIHREFITQVNLEEGYVRVRIPPGLSQAMH